MAKATRVLSTPRRTASKTNPPDQAPMTPDDEIGMAWWNALTKQDRAKWSAIAGNTGWTKNAWEVFKAAEDEGLAPAIEYTSDDLVSDLQHLFDLVDTIVESLVGIDRGNLDIAEQNELNRAASLAWITRDQLELIKDRLSQKNDAGAAAGSESAKPQGAGRKESRV
jgi:hypothetical protein